MTIKKFCDLSFHLNFIKMRARGNLTLQGRYCHLNSMKNFLRLCRITFYGKLIASFPFIRRTDPSPEFKLKLNRVVFLGWWMAIKSVISGHLRNGIISLTPPCMWLMKVYYQIYTNYNPWSNRLQQIECWHSLLLHCVTSPTNFQLHWSAQIAENIGKARVPFDCIDILVMILAILASSTFRFIWNSLRHFLRSPVTRRT